MLTGLASSFAADTLTAVLQASPLTYWVVIALSAVFFGIMRAMLPTEGLATIYLPFVAFGGLVSPYILQSHGIGFTHEVFANTIFMVTIGTTFMLVVLVVLTRVWYVLSARDALERGDIAGSGPARTNQVDIGRALRRARDE